MKILILSDMVGGPGGAFKTIEQIDQFMPERVQVHVAVDTVAQEPTQNNYQLTSVDFIPLSYKFHTESAIIEAINQQLETYKPDVVHVMNGSIKSNLLIRKYLISKKIPFVVTESLIDSSLKLSDALIDELREINAKTPHVIYVSKKNSLLARQVFGVYPKNFSVISNAVEPIKNKKVQFSSQPSRFYTTARCVPQKGIDIVIRALAKIQGHRLSFDVIGDGEYRLEYEKLAKDLLGVRHDFRVTGWQEKIDQSLVAQYDVFISASREEGLSLSILEAASLGMPIICSRASGNDELLEACDCGQLFDVDDSDALAQCILDYIKNPKVLNTKATQGASKVDQQFSLAKNMERIEKIYRSTISL